MNSLVRFSVENGGTDTNILIPNHFLNGYYSSGNPSCVYFNGKLYLNTRLVNYKKILQSEHANFINDYKNQTYYLDDSGFNSRNVMFIYEEGKFLSYKEIDYGYGNVESFYRGLEDVRLVVWNNKLYSYGTRWDVTENVGCICIYEFDNELNISNEIIVKNFPGVICEKNWGAIENMPFCFVYTTNKTFIVQIDNDGNCSVILEHDLDENFPDYIKGSTPVIRYNDKEYITLVHRTTYEKDKYGIEKSKYHTAFVFYDDNFHITRMSDWFVFRTNLCEFTCGLTRNNNVVYITYSQIDCTSNLLEIPLNLIETFVNNTREYGMYDREYIYSLAKRHEINDQYFTATVLFNYAAILSEQNDGIKYECIVKTFAGLVSELNTIKKATHIERFKNCIRLAIENYHNPKELYYLLSAVYRCDDDLEEATKYKHIGDSINMLVMPEFTNYINIDYL